MILNNIKRILQPAKIVNLILILICLCGFVYQVYLILTQYMLGKTVVNIDVKRLRAQPLPAITVCVETSLSITKLSKLNENNQLLYQDYMKVLNESITTKRLKKFKNLTEDVTFDLRQKYSKIRDDNAKMKDLQDLFDLSITPESIKVMIFGKIVSDKSLLNQTFKLEGDKKFILNKTPIGSFIISNVRSLWKCFTYFSALDQYWNTFIFDLDYLQLYILNNHDQYAPEYKYQIAIHSPNIIPKYSPDNFFEAQPYEEINVKYSQINKELVPDSFETNCYEYNIRNEYGTIRMENDCLLHCFVDKTKQKFKSITFSSNYLIRRELYSSYDKIPSNFCNWCDDEVEHVKICFEKCKPDCNTIQFFTEIKKTYYQSWSSDEMVYCNFVHNLIPDVVVRHTLEMTLMSFVCNFGGLLGMWLGFSVLSITKDDQD